jgi:hypothetical protein
MTNAPAIFRSLIVYAICVPLAIMVGYSLTKEQRWGVVQSSAMVYACIGHYSGVKVSTHD